MKRIWLGKGKYALVDDWNYDWLSKFTWRAEKSHKTWYAACQLRVGKFCAKFRMHREILGCQEGMETDHMDGNGLNNLESNLRACDHRGNGRNLRNQSRHGVGIEFFPRSTKRPWVASISLRNKKIHLGNFRTKEEAKLERFRAEYAVALAGV